MTTTSLPTAIVQRLHEEPGRYERCPADPEFARQLADRIIDSECQQVMFAALRDDWLRATTDAYDGARKALEMLLLSAGWRVRNAPGAHIATGDVATAWLQAADPPGPRIAKSFTSSRPARHANEYPDPRDPPLTRTTLRGYTLDNIRLVNLVRVHLGLDDRPELVPTDDNIAAWRASL